MGTLYIMKGPIKSKRLATTVFTLKQLNIENIFKMYLQRL